MLKVNFSEFAMIYSLYIVSYYLFGRRLKKKRLDIVFINLTIFWEK